MPQKTSTDLTIKRVQDTCIHCGLHSPNGPFCCAGCHTVYDILHISGLSGFYKLKDQLESAGSQIASQYTPDEFLFLDDLTSQSPYIQNETCRFYVEGMHCAACIWLIEKLDRLAPKIQKIQVDFSSSTVQITIEKGGKWAVIASALTQLGYRVTPLKKDEDTLRLAHQDGKKTLIKIGIAGFASGNIMILSVSQYAGAGLEWGPLFTWISLLLCLPVMLVSATPFYKGAIGAIKSKIMSIDVPIALAILLGFSLSTYHCIVAQGEVYFDCIAVFVFLLLSSRHFLKQAYQKYAHHGRLYTHLLPDTVTLKVDGLPTQSRHISTLAINDIIIVPKGGIIPCDGILMSPNAYIDTHILTGEFSAQNHHQGAHVFAGTKATETDLEIKATHVGTQTRVSQIIASLKEDSKPQMVLLADHLSQWFLALTLLLSLGVFIVSLLQGDSSLGTSKSLAIIMVACPCALALSTPLTYALAGNQLGMRGIILRRSDVLGRLRKIKHICFDKTGTLTKGEMSISTLTLGPHPLLKDISEALSIAYAMQYDISHPIATAIRKYAIAHTITPHSNVKNQTSLPSIGVSGTLGEAQLTMKALPKEMPITSQSHTAIGLWIDTHLVLSIELNDTLQESAKETISQLKAHTHSLAILSGDPSQSATIVGKMVGINEVHSGMSPENKAHYLASHKHTLMVGDGANDVSAMACAWVSIAVQGSLDIGLKSSDIYLSQPSLIPIPHLIDYAKTIHQTVVFSLALSLTYNVTGIVMVLMGIINPLVAAIIMPLSSVSVLGVSLVGTSKIKGLAKLK